MNKKLNENSMQHQFDAYCKKVLRNEVRNKKTRLQNEKREEPLSYVNEKNIHKLGLIH